MSSDLGMRVKSEAQSQADNVGESPDRGRPVHDGPGVVDDPHAVTHTH